MHKFLYIFEISYSDQNSKYIMKILFIFLLLFCVSISNCDEDVSDRKAIVRDFVKNITQIVVRKANNHIKQRIQHVQEYIRVSKIIKEMQPVFWQQQVDYKLCNFTLYPYPSCDLLSETLPEINNMMRTRQCDFCEEVVTCGKVDPLLVIFPVFVVMLFKLLLPGSSLLVTFISWVFMFMVSYIRLVVYEVDLFDISTYGGNFAPIAGSTLLLCLSDIIRTRREAKKKKSD